MVKRPHHNDRATNPDLNRVLRAQSCIVPEVAAEVRGQGLRVPSQSQTKHGQAQQRRNFRRGEDVLNRGARSQSKNIHHRQENHQQDCHQILGVDAHVHVAQHHRAKVNRRDLPEVQQPVSGRNRWNEYAQEFAERHAYGSNGSGLNDQEESPAIEKSP